MRKFSKNIALLMALVMLVALMPTAMADEGDGSGDIMPMSLQPITEYGAYDPIVIDLTDLDPDALDKVPMKTILERLNTALDERDLSDGKVDVENSTVAWTKRYSSYSFGERDDYKLLGAEGDIDLDVGYTVYELEWPDFDYSVTDSDIADLRSFYTNDPACVYLLLVVGEKGNDQLDTQNKRYVVQALLPQENKILDFTATNADEGAENAPITILDAYSYLSLYDKDVSVDSYYVYIPLSYDGSSVSLKMDFKAALKDKYTDLEIYQGLYNSREDAASGIKLENNTYTDEFNGSWHTEEYTAFYKDHTEKERVYHFSVRLTTTGISLSCRYLKDKNNRTIYGTSDYIGGDFWQYVFELEDGMNVNDEYTLFMRAYDPEFPENSDAENIKFACEGRYFSKEEAEADGKTDIKEQLFGSDGYKSDKFAEGIEISVIDNNNRDRAYSFMVAPYVAPEPTEPVLSDGTSLTIYGVNKTESGGYYQIFASKDDTNNKRTDEMKEIYQTVFILDSEANIMANANGYIYPTWTASSGAKVYWADASGAAATEKTSGESPLKFTPGEPVNITVAPENGGSPTNYYVTFIAQKEEAELYVLGENVKDNNYDEENEIPGRLVHLGDIERRETYYDIMFANIGNTNLSGITVSWEKDPEIVKIDDYWTVTEGAELGAFDSVYDSSGLRYGVLGNIGKIRLVPTYDEEGKIVHGEIDGILKIAAGDKVVRIKITGVAGTPKIVTETLSDQDAVKWVPYGVILQTNYVGDEGDKIAFEVNSDYVLDTLPAGIELTKAGALYGVPLSEPGEYDFKVRLVYFEGSERYVLDEKEYTLTVEDNSDENVWNETDQDYSVIRYIGDDSGDYHFVITEPGDKVFSSNGTFDQFVAFYLDGKKLERDVDYTADPGSTVITIYDETIDSTDDGQTHTIAAEFRTDGTKEDEEPTSEIKRAAQNYTVDIVYNDDYDDDYDYDYDDPGKEPAGSDKPTTPSTPDDKTKAFPFSDVKESDWEYAEVKWAYEKDWMVGISDTLFDPDSPVSQAIIVTVLARMQGVDLTKYDGVTYPGIPEGQWYTNAAIWAKQAGLLPDVDFTENAPTERGRMAIMLVKYLRSMGVDVSDPAVPYVFKDASDMTEDVQTAFQILYKLGIFYGIGDMRMAPLSNTSRCEFATLIHRIANVIAK